MTNVSRKSIQRYSTLLIRFRENETNMWYYYTNVKSKSDSYKRTKKKKLDERKSKLINVNFVNLLLLSSIYRKKYRVFFYHNSW